jgi:hypothetical protein
MEWLSFFVALIGPGQIRCKVSRRKFSDAYDTDTL